MNISGKLIIVSILAVALAGAAASWSFRYTSTHRAAQFWGPQAAQLIRDAPIVELYEGERLPDDALRSGFTKSDLETAGGREISYAPGLVHLRHALLEDRSYRWPAEHVAPGEWGWALAFRDSQKEKVAVVLIADDWKHVGTIGKDQVVSSQPISSGLAQFIDQLASNSPTSAR